MPESESVIGLEVHCQLATASKLFCPCPSGAFGVAPNANICPVCTGQPGALPVLNRGAVERAFTAALALDCRIRPESIFARKNYFYPDLPKGYQISQYEEPFSEEGGLEIAGPPARRVRIQRIHMEEDAGKLLHAIGAEELPYSLVDFNRAGVPLVEIVTHPDFRTPEEAYQYLAGLKAVLQYAGVSRCDMEKGEMRCDANISLRPKGAATLGTKIEVKNLNSFKAVREALDYEARRQAEALGRGERLRQETRSWDAGRGVTEPLRSKEEAHDYRYFPEPDLVPLVADEAWVARIREALPELPAARRARYVARFQLSEYDAGVLTADRELAELFEGTLAAGEGLPPKAVANLIQSEFLARLNAEGKRVAEAPVGAKHLASLVGLTQGGTLSSKLAKEVFAKAWESGEDPKALVAKLGLTQVSDSGAIKEWVAAAIAANPRAAEDFRGGKQAAIGSLVGQVMKLSKGKANPALVNELLREALARP